MPRLGFAISHGGAASLCATLRSGAVSLCAMLRGGAASLYATLRWSAASLFATFHGGAASLAAALSLGRRGTLPLASHDGGAVPSSVSCRSARVLALHACGAEVAVMDVVVVVVAVGAVVVVAWIAGWG